MVESKKRLRKIKIESDIGFFPVLALNCLTKTDKKPFIFLFAELDDISKDQLRRVIKYFAKNDLTCYWWPTAKGWHVVSPDLLSIEEWYKMRKPLKFILANYYEFLNIRVSKKPSDPEDQRLRMWLSDGSRLQSATLHRYIQGKFKTNLPYDKEKSVETYLGLVKYEEFYLDQHF